MSKNDQVEFEELEGFSLDKCTVPVKYKDPEKEGVKGDTLLDKCFALCDKNNCTAFTTWEEDGKESCLLTDSNEVSIDHTVQFFDRNQKWTYNTYVRQDIADMNYEERKRRKQ